MCQGFLGWICWPKSRFNERNDPWHPPDATAGDPKIALRSV